MWSYSTASYATCQVQGGCNFAYNGEWATPYVQASSSAVVPGGVLSFGGRLRGMMAGQYQVIIHAGVDQNCELDDLYVYTNENGEEVEGNGRRHRRGASTSTLDSLEASMGFRPTTVSNDAYNPDVGAGDVDERKMLKDYRDYVRASCQLPPTLEAGRYNYSVYVAPGPAPGVPGFSGEAAYGNAMFSEQSSLAGQCTSAAPLSHDDVWTGTNPLTFNGVGWHSRAPLDSIGSVRSHMLLYDVPHTKY